MSKSSKAKMRGTRWPRDITFCHRMTCPGPAAGSFSTQQEQPIISALSPGRLQMSPKQAWPLRRTSQLKAQNWLLTSHCSGLTVRCLEASSGRGGRYGIFQKNEYFHWMNNQKNFWMNIFFEWILSFFFEWIFFWMNNFFFFWMNIFDEWIIRFFFEWIFYESLFCQ